jgi:hypothetical protein
MYAAPPIDLVGSRDDTRIADMLGLMRRRFEMAMEWHQDWRRNANEWLKFKNGEHWVPEDREKRREKGRPCLTINTLPQYERQITNEQRRNRPAMHVIPVRGGADVDKARIWQGILRHLEQQSHAEIAYDTAAEQQIDLGLGHWRYVLDYEDEYSFDQVLKVARFRNPLAVLMDPLCQDPTGRGSEWGFIFELHDREVFQYEFGVSGSDFAFWETMAPDWFNSHTVRVAEYFWRDMQRATLVQLEDGSTELLEQRLMAPMATPDEYPDFHDEALQDFIVNLTTPEPRYKPLLPWMQSQLDKAMQQSPFSVGFSEAYLPRVRDTLAMVRQARATQVGTTRWIKTNGATILEESIWPGRHIPIVRVTGEEIVIDDKPNYSGIIKNAVDPMRMVDYWVTMQAEHIALSPVPPWLIAEGQLEGFKPYWAVANTEPMAYLPYKVVTDGKGDALPPPQRTSVEPAIGAITQAMSDAERHTQQAVGIYNAGLGAQSNEIAGVAIKERNAQSDTGTYHYHDNLGRSIEYGGDICLDVLPHILTAEKVQRILGEDKKVSHVLLKPGAEDTKVPDDMKEIVEAVFDPSVGQYCVQVEMGASFASKREESVQHLIEYVAADPTAAPLLGHIIMGNMDFDEAREAARLLKSRLPTELQEEGNGELSAEDQLAMVKRGMAQLTEQMKALDAFAQQQQQEVALLQQDNMRLKDAYEIKRGELALRAREVELKAEEVKIKAFSEASDAQVAQDRMALEQIGTAGTLAAQHAGAPPGTGDLAAMQSQLDRMTAMLQRLVTMEASEQEGMGHEATAEPDDDTEGL